MKKNIWIVMLLLVLVGVFFVIREWPTEQELLKKESEALSEAEVKQSNTAEMKESESSLVENTGNSSIMEKTTVDGVEQITFLPESEADQPILKIGVLMSAERSGSNEERWAEWLHELNSYLTETQQEYQIKVRLYSFSAFDEEAKEKAEEQCFASDCDIVYGEFYGIEKAKFSDVFVNLEETLKNGDLNSVYQFFPEMYWEYIATQLAGIYAIFPDVTFYGGAGVSLDGGLMKQLGYSWEYVAGENKTIEEWNQIFENLASEHNAKEFINISPQEASDVILPHLLPELEAEIIAPGVGIDFETGEVLKIYEMPGVKERIQMIQHWYDEGWISKGYSDSPIQSFSRISLTGVQAMDSFFDASEKAYIYSIENPSYYAMDLEAMVFCGILKNSVHQELVVDFLNLTEGDEELRLLLGRDTRWLGLTPNVYYTWSEESTPLKNYLNQEMVSQSEMVSESYTDVQIPALCGFVFDPTPVQSQIEEIRIIVSRANDARLDFGMYDGWQEDLDTLWSQLDEAGIDDIVEEAERQIVEFQLLKENVSETMAE